MVGVLAAPGGQIATGHEGKGRQGLSRKALSHGEREFKKFIHSGGIEMADFAKLVDELSGLQLWKQPS